MIPREPCAILHGAIVVMKCHARENAAGVNMEAIMKIGDLSRKLNVSIHAIRHYISLGLLVPERNGKLFDFDPQAVEDLHLIIRLKDMGFTLKEIQTLISLHRTSNWVEPDIMGEYINALQKKTEEHHAQIQLYRNYLDRINVELESVEQQIDSSQSLIGVPLRAMEYLCCPECKESLTAKDVQMNSRYIYNGKLYCSRCQYALHIDNGIVSSPYIGGFGTPDVEREKYHDIPSPILTLMQKSYLFVLQNLQNNSGESSVILETDANEFFFLYTHFRKLGKRALYIITDRFPQVLRMYKQRIEYMKLDLDILYLADRSGDYPIKPHSIDISIDYFSSNFRQAAGLPPVNTQNLLGDGGKQIGCYYIPVSGENPHGFSIHKCRQSLREIGIKELAKSDVINCNSNIPAEMDCEHSIFLYMAGKQ